MQDGICVKCALKLLDIDFAVLVQNMSTHAGNHVILCVSRIALSGLQALWYVLEHLEDPITAQTLIETARIVTRGASDETLERFRTIPVYVTGREGINYTPPDAE